MSTKCSVRNGTVLFPSDSVVLSSSVADTAALYVNLHGKCFVQELDYPDTTSTKLKN